MSTEMVENLWAVAEICPEPRCGSSRREHNEQEVTRSISAVTEVSHIFRTRRTTDFKLDARMTHDDPHHRHVR